MQLVAELQPTVVVDRTLVKWTEEAGEMNGQVEANGNAAALADLYDEVQGGCEREKHAVGDRASECPLLFSRARGQSLGALA